MGGIIQSNTIDNGWKYPVMTMTPGGNILSIPLNTGRKHPVHTIGHRAESSCPYHWTPGGNIQSIPLDTKWNIQSIPSDTGGHLLCHLGTPRPPRGHLLGHQGTPSWITQKQFLGYPGGELLAVLKHLLRLLGNISAVCGVVS